MGQSTTLRLYLDAFWISPYSFSAYVALKEKGLPMELVELALEKGEHRLGDFPRRSHTGKIPAIDDGGFWLAESSAIIEYLDDKYGAPRHPRLLPEGVEDRARARMVMAWIRSDLLALREERPTTTMFYQRAQKPLTEAGAAAALKLVQLAGELIPEDRTSLFPLWSIADADLAFMLQRLVMNGHEVPSHVRAFVDAQWARPSVRSYVDRKRPAYTGY